MPDAAASTPDAAEPLATPLTTYDRPLELLQERARQSYASLARMETKVSTMFGVGIKARLLRRATFWLYARTGLLVIIRFVEAPNVARAAPAIPSFVGRLFQMGINV